MPVGKNDISVRKGNKKATRCELVAFSIPFWQGGLFP